MFLGKKVKKTEEFTNAKKYPCLFYFKHLETGLAGYENETILLDNDEMKNMIPTFVGKPVYVHHQEVDLSNLKEEAHGYVVESFYNELDGWLWVKCLITDDVAMQAIANGWKCSNAYIPSEWGEGGTHHNVPYDRRIVNGEFTHMAIVPNPRYEEADILTPDEFKIYQETKRARLAELQNSKTEPKKGNSMFTFFKSVKQETTEIDNDTVMEIKNSDGTTQEIKISEMVNAVVAAKKAEKEEAEKQNAKAKLNESTMVRVGDEDMPLSDLMATYNAMCKKNESESESDEEEEEELDNESEDKKEEEEEKTNSKTDHFKELSNAASKAKENVQVLETSQNMLERGKTRYGSGN